MSSVLGLRGTGQFNTDFRPTNYRELFTLLEPNGSAPLNALLSMASSEATDDPKFNHFRDELPGRTLRINNGPGYNTTDTALVVVNTADIRFAITNSTLVNLRTGELMRCTADGNFGTNTVTVSRNIGGTSFTINNNDVLVVAGFADQEGAGKPQAVMFDPTMDFNYTQIFKTGVNVTGTLAQTKLRTGPKEQEAITKALKMHMTDIERAMFLGRRHEENGTSAQPRRYTGGLLTLIPNVIDAASGFATANTITENEFDRVLIEQVFAWGNKQKLAFCGPRVIANLQRIAKARWQPTQVSGSYGVSMTQYSTFAGDLLVHLHPLFRQVAGMESMMIIVDLPYLKYRYMEGRDTQLKRDIQAPDADGKEHYYMTECGLELAQGRPHTVIRNWQGT